MGKVVLFFVVFLFTVARVLAQSPLAYWTFDGAQYTNDQTGRQKIDVTRYKAGIQQEKGQVGKSITPSVPTALIVTNLFVATPRNTDYTLEFLFKGEQFMFTTFPAPEFRINFVYSALQVTIQVKKNGAVKKYNWNIPLKGSGITSYNTLADGTWHHYALTIRRSGDLRFWIDGQTDPVLGKKIEPFDQLAITNKDGFRVKGSLDELAFYSVALGDDLIKQHAAEAANGQPYTFTKRAVPLAASSRTNEQPQMPAGASSQPQKTSGPYDPMEFAPGYPNYTVQATDQLQYFPSPRFYRGQPMKRNFPWCDISYLHRELPAQGGKGFGKINPQRAVEMVNVLAKRWNYYVELPCIRQDSVTVNKTYSSPGSVHYALIRYAREHPELPTASVLMQVQGKPVHAGFNRNKPFENGQDLPENYYLRDGQGKVILSSNKKWLSPLAPLDIVKNDAKTTAFYLRQLGKYLGRPIDMLNDNGEIFGHMRPETLLGSDPAVKRDMEQKRLSNTQYNGWFQNRLDTCYKNEILRSLKWNKTLFTFYNVSAYNSNYWPDYAMRRTTNSVINGNHYSTPSFYPASPDNWRRSAGAQNGYGVVAEGRRKEIAMGDKFFAPFVCAGWGLEEKNVRPAQWLALLKSMVMMGADFFHVGYFNVTGRTGWPNGVGPNDPRGYIYQVAMPVYAQAIASRIYPFLQSGELLNPQNNLDPSTYTFRFKGTKVNHLILVRKMGKKYLIYGSVQPNSNFKDNVPIEEATQIMLDGMNLQFKIRKQGSMYVLDASRQRPVFYQLDGWHQYEHPYYWSKDIQIEAENADELLEKELLFTSQEGSYDFRNFTTWLQLSSGQSAGFDIPVQAKEQYQCILNIRKSGNEDAVVAIEGATTIQKTVGSKEWVRLSLTPNESGNIVKGKNRITIKIIRGSVDIDWVKF